jgi:hypothetical protein
VYHHVTTFFIWWSLIRYGPGGDPFFTCMINSLVHVFMYAYYFAASRGYRNNFLKVRPTPWPYHPSSLPGGATWSDARFSCPFLHR